jgi:hypothetical protein
VTGELIEAEKYTPPAKSKGPIIVTDIAPFVSPIDGSVISGRASMRDHMRQHGVTHTQDYANTWQEQAKERADPRRGRAGRIEALRRAIERGAR